MKTPPTKSAYIIENTDLKDPLPKGSIIAIDIEFYSAYEMVKNRKYGMNCAARVVLLTKIKKKSREIIF